MIHRPSRQAKTLLVDAALGLMKPRQGVVKFLDSDWTRVSYGNRMLMRSKIGRIFERGGWASNLSLDDNIRLQMRHHTAEPEDVITTKLQSLCKRFGIEIPSSRIAYVQADLLRMCQWVRALLCQPTLLIAENPFSKVPSEHHCRFNEVEFEHRRAGGATLWVTDNPFIWQRDLQGVVTRYKIDGERLVRVGQ